MRRCCGSLSILYLRCPARARYAHCLSRVLRLSILYLRCPGRGGRRRRFSVVRLSILYLRCSHELRLPCGGCHVALSILYLRCRRLPRAREVRKDASLSILYLRCQHAYFVRLGIDTRIAFNSLFEMRRDGARDTAESPTRWTFQFSI